MQTINKLKGITDLLGELRVTYEVHMHDEDEFAFLKTGEVSVKIPDPYTERTLFVDFQSEMSLFFGVEWHDHYYPNEDGYRKLLDTLRGLLTNEYCSAAVFVGDERKWGGSMLSDKSSVYGKAPEEIFAEPFPNMADEYRKAWEEKGAEIHFLFWNTEFDKIITIEKSQHL